MDTKQKIIINCRDDDSIVTYQKSGCDPYYELIAGDISCAISQIPAVMNNAEENWNTNGNFYPQYKAPFIPKPSQPPKSKGSGKASTPPAEELPLLRELEDKQKKDETPALVDETHEDTPAPPGETHDTGDETHEDTPAPPDETHDTGDETHATTDAIPESAEKSAESETPAPPPPVKAKRGRKKKQPEIPAEPATSATTETGKPTRKTNVQYQTITGKGPFDTIQAALDALGFPEDHRPKHNRYNRLSKDLQAQIIVLEAN